MDWVQGLEIGASIVAIFAALYGAIQFIDRRIDEKIHEESFLRKISASLRPVIIFDEDDSILFDQGGMDVIEKIETSHSVNSEVPEQIIIYPKKHLANAPLLQTLENEFIDIKVSRGKGYQWCYRLEYRMWDENFSGKRRFRLEVLL